MTGFHLENSTIILRARIIFEPGEPFFLLLNKVSSDRVKEGMEKNKNEKKNLKRQYCSQRTMAE